MLNEQYGILQLIIKTLFRRSRAFVWLANPYGALFWIAVSEVWGWVGLYTLMFIRHARLYLDRHVRGRKG